MILILTALCEGKLFTLQEHHARDQLLQLRTERRFFCPSCQSPITLKIGTIKIPHFAHHKGSSCKAPEPESALHLLGKSRLASFFQQRHTPFRVEQYLPEIKQRPDLLLPRAAIEFQCSNIAPEKVALRSSGYEQLGLEPIWIRGLDHNPPAGLAILQIRPFEQQMFRGTDFHPYLIHFNPHSSSFIYFSNLFYLQGNRYAGKTSLLPGHQQAYPFAVPKRLNQNEYGSIAALFRQEAKKFIRSQLFAKNRMRNPFWRLTYELQLDREAIPEVFGLPLPGGHWLREHPLLWQMKIALMVESGKPIESLIDKQLVNRAFPDEAPDKILGLFSTYETIYRRSSNKGALEMADISYQSIAKAWEN